MRSADEEIEWAKTLESSGEDELALAAWRSLSGSSPSLYVFCRLGKLYERLGSPREAERSFSAALKTDPASAIPLVALGTLARNQRDYESSECYLRRALAIEPKSGTWVMLGAALKALGRDREEEEAYRQALRLDPGCEEAHYNLGALLRNSNSTEAQAHFENALDLDPDYSLAHRELGFLLWERDSGPIAEYHLRRAIEINPRDAWAHVYLGGYLERVRDFSSAAREYEVGAEVEPQQAFPLWALADLYERREDWGLALSFYSRAIQLEPDDVGSNLGLGRLYKKRGDTVMAREYLNRALFLDPDSEAVQKLLDEIAE